MRRKQTQLQPIVSEEQREAAFEELISGEYSDLYQRKLGDAVKNAVAQAFHAQPSMQQMPGVPVQQMSGVPMQGVSDQQAQARLRRWAMEEQQMRAVYPDFDLKSEMENPQFFTLLKADVPMLQAYELVHLDELKTEAARNAARAITEQMNANARIKGARPSENGMSSHSAALVKNDVHNLSREDRAEIVRRAQRGETIRF